jgi:hypothetical protein
MKRLVLAAIVLLGTQLAAHADYVNYTNMLKQPRSDAELNADVQYCDQRVGPNWRGVPTSAAYKSCMRSRGWRFDWERVERTWIDPDTGNRCHSILGGVGSECSNY